MTKQRKINSTYAIVMVIGLAFMLLFGYLVKPFSTVTVTGVKMLGVLIGLIIITCFNGDLLSGSLMALLATLFHGYYDISGLLSEWLAPSLLFSWYSAVPCVWLCEIRVQ